MKTHNKRQLIRNIFFNFLIVFGIFGSFFSPETVNEQHISDAYLDPSTGSMIISAIVGIFATIVLGIKTFWYKIVSIFRPAKKDQQQNTITK